MEEKRQRMTNDINELGWVKITEDLHTKGYSNVPNVLTIKECENLVQLYEVEYLFRKKVVMERHRFGKGEYKYFDYPLPRIVQKLRESIYPNLVPIANQWMKALKIDFVYPNSLQELLVQCQANEQKKATSLLLKYGPGGYNTLHRDIYGTIYFPLQTVFFLNEPDEEFTGGEFVLTQQTPRTQSKAIVLKPRKGDMLVFTTNFRPIQGIRGYYRANMRHGVSEIKTGQRNTLGIIYHDAIS